MWDLLFARQVELLGSARRLAVPRRDRPAAAVAPGRSRRRRAERDPGAAHRLADGGGAGAGARRHLLRDAERAGVPGRQFHPHARAARLSRGAGLLPRHVRPYPDAGAPRFRRDGRACRAAWDGGDRRRRGRPGGAALLAQRRVRAGARAWRAEDPRRGPRVQLRRSAFQPGERRRSSACPSRSSGRSTRLTGTTPSSRATSFPNRSSGRSPKCWR